MTLTETVELKGLGSVCLGSFQQLQQLPGCGSRSPNKQHFLAQLQAVDGLERSTYLHYDAEAAISVLLPAAAGSKLTFTGIPSHQIPYYVPNATERLVSISTQTTVLASHKHNHFLS
jgi:hypothetical protein